MGDTLPGDDPWFVNSLATEPGEMVIPDGATNRTLDRLAAAGVSWQTIPYTANHKNGWGLPCETTPLRRDSL